MTTVSKSVKNYLSSGRENGPALRCSTRLTGSSWWRPRRQTGNPIAGQPSDETLNDGKSASEAASSPSPDAFKPRLNNQSSVEDAIKALISSSAETYMTPTGPETPGDTPWPGHSKLLGGWVLGSFHTPQGPMGAPAPEISASLTVGKGRPRTSGHKHKAQSQSHETVRSGLTQTSILTEERKKCLG